MSKMNSLIFTGSVPASPSPPKRNNNNSNSEPDQQQQSSTPRRKWHRKCTSVKNYETEEQKEIQRKNGIDSGLIRLTKSGEAVNVPWRDPTPSQIFKHNSSRQERSCLDHFDEPVFTSFSGRFALQRQPLKVQMGLPLPQEKLTLSQRRSLSHRKLEDDATEASKILPPPARPARLPVALCTTASDNEDDDDDDYELSEYGGGEEYKYYSTGTLSDMPPSTNNNEMMMNDPTGQSSSSPYNKKMKIIDSNIASPSSVVAGGVAAAAAASPSVRSHHLNKKKEREELERQLHHLQHFAGSASSIPRASHSPRALRQYMTPTTPRLDECDADIRHGGHSTNDNRGGSSARPATARERSSSGSHHHYHHNRPHDFFLASPPRSQGPMHVNDLMNITKRPRPQSANVVLAVSERISELRRREQQHQKTPDHQKETTRSKFDDQEDGELAAAGSSSSRCSTSLPSTSRPPSSINNHHHHQNYKNRPISSGKKPLKLDVIAKIAGRSSTSEIAHLHSSGDYQYNHQSSFQTPIRSFGKTVLSGDMSQERASRNNNNNSRSSNGRQQSATPETTHGYSTHTSFTRVGSSTMNNNTFSGTMTTSHGSSGGGRFSSGLFGRTVTIVDEK